MPDCQPSLYAQEVEAFLDRVSPSEASDLLFGPFADWTDAQGMVSDSLIGASISWADLSLIVNGELAGLQVLGGGCVDAGCTTNMTMAVADGDWDRAVWWAFDDRSGASEALGFELTESESDSDVCWSVQYGAPVVYTFGSSPGMPERAWLFATDRKWYQAEVDVIRPTSNRHSDGGLVQC